MWFRSLLLVLDTGAHLETTLTVSWLTPPGACSTSIDICCAYLECKYRLASVAVMLLPKSPQQYPNISGTSFFPGAVPCCHDRKLGSWACYLTQSQPVVGEQAHVTFQSCTGSVHRYSNGEGLEIPQTGWTDARCNE